MLKMLVSVGITPAGGVANDPKGEELGAREMVHPVGRDKVNRPRPMCAREGGSLVINSFLTVTTLSYSKKSI